jgi:hypothetical protein
MMSIFTMLAVKCLSYQLLAGIFQPESDSKNRPDQDSGTGRTTLVDYLIDAEARYA